ncbi:MAG: thioredoxin [Candidatus Komeilibacteria bacterium CG10_big_fil_rev_8_21_14_0_10_41_13]|uniref:Thioredoxin n=1 Tax=Candidatus Komeilibacteria bacterium CG10_big_fil_rev_8_21_14_0_10_41_13 TaxID=1974476 RepID=A0A2M6WCR6_9BACT|nr:MAG: thioredoxin [Candidatus Komeilibacteria bacterium CG10_big_fil_rev_8_21_14_0_10_41_13]
MEITSQNFEAEVLKSEQPVMVDFFATWCGPCQILAPTVEELAQEYKGKAKIGKLDIDQNQELASQYQVMSVPTLIFFKGGQEVDRIMGVQSKEAFKEKLDNLL